jgi:hypothetical protein
LKLYLSCSHYSEYYKAFEDVDIGDKGWYGFDISIIIGLLWANSFVIKTNLFYSSMLQILVRLHFLLLFKLLLVGLGVL